MLPTSNPIDSLPIHSQVQIPSSFDSQSSLAIDFKTASISEAIKYFSDARMNELKVSFITSEIDIAESTSQAARKLNKQTRYNEIEGKSLMQVCLWEF